MTEICSKNICTGCGACLNICPKQCIHMVQDVEGFLFPEINLQKCNSCDACKQVCPALSTQQALPPNRSPKIYACWNHNDTTRFQSASGGVFSALANNILNRHGVVYGAAFDENAYLKHIGIENTNELGRLRSSKYIQSDTGTVYSDVKQYLKQRRPVLFSGTPCQVAALRAYVGNDDNLFTCDLLCHGVPSPGLFAKYVNFLEKRFGSKLSTINFRHKRTGWETPNTVANFRDSQKHVLKGLCNLYLRGFQLAISLRRSCYQCAYTSIVRYGDVSLGDFSKIGEIQPFKHSVKQGISLVLTNTEKGETMLKSCSEDLYIEQRSLAEARHSQFRLSKPARKPSTRELFFADYQRLEYEELAKKYMVEKGWKAFVRPLVPPAWILFVKKRVKKITGR